MIGIDDFIFSAAFAAIAGAVVNGISQGFTNKSNEEINQRNLDYNAAQTQAAWERDDSAHQREVADLKAAGLSPLASTGGLSVTSPLSAPNPIAMQAPQVDVNALVQGVLGSKELEETKRHNEQIEKYRSTEVVLEAAKVAQKAQELNLENKKVDSQIKYYAKINELEAEKIQETIRSHKKNEDIEVSEHEARVLEHQSRMFLEDISHQLGGMKIPYQEVYDLEIYEKMNRLFSLQFDHFIQEIGATKTSSAQASSNSVNGSLGGNVGLPGGPVAPSFGATGSGGSSASKYSMESYDLSELQKQKWNHFVLTHKKPVYIDKKKYDRMYK